MKKIICKDTGEVCYTYFEYLNSRHWKHIKTKFKAINKKCCLCGETKGLEIHHKTYEDIGNELESQLIVLCRSCHQISHDLGGGLKINEYLIKYHSEANKPIIKTSTPIKPKKKKRSGDTWTKANKIR